MKLPSVLTFLSTCLILLCCEAVHALEGTGGILPEPSAQSAPEQMGEWVVKSINGEELPEGIPSATFRFSADGSIVRRIGTVEQKGTYAFSADRKSLELESGRGNEKLDVEELTETAVTIVVGDEKIVLSRLPPGKEETVEREVERDLEGIWKMIALGGEKVRADDDTIFEFKADGTVPRTRSGTIKNGIYSLSADKALLTLNHAMELSRIVQKEEEGKGADGEDGKEGEPGEPAEEVPAAEPKNEGKDEDEEEPAERPKDGKIYGRWRVVAMEGFPKDIEKPTFQFNQDGTVTGSFGEQVKHGKFKLSDDRSTLTMMDKGQALEDGEVAEVRELSETVMELKADDMIMRFERIRK